MARKDFRSYVLFLRDVIIRWPEYGSGFKVRGQDLSQIQAKKAKIESLNEQIGDMQTLVNNLRAERTTLCSEVDKFNNYLRMALAATFGEESAEYRNRPNFFKRGPGRPRKTYTQKRAEAAREKRGSRAGKELSCRHLMPWNDGVSLCAVE